MTFEHHDYFMNRCLELARRGAGLVSPNPMVGAVVVHEGRIIGEGWHQRYGDAHAEVHAIRSVADSALLKSSTLYVSLEPCSHTGKTPPCADLIIESGIRSVIIGVGDPNPKVSGAGIRRLLDVNISVTCPVAEQAARELNAGFLSAHERARPWVILKWAQSSDGFMAPADGRRIAISGDEARSLVHQWRATEDCVLVGTSTALLDDPELTVRYAEGRNPCRAVLDMGCRLPNTLKLFDGTARTFLLNSRYSEDRGDVRYRLVDASTSLPHGIIGALHTERIQSVIVEGGAKLLNSFISAGLWDEARIFVSPYSLNQGLSAPNWPAAVATQTKIGMDSLKIIHNPISWSWLKGR